MKQSINLPLDAAYRDMWGGWQNLREALGEFNLDGVEGIWAGVDIPQDFPRDLLVGYHLTFYPDWLDFYRDDKRALAEKYGSVETAYRYFGGQGADFLLQVYRDDIKRAERLGAAYIVFHVSDTSNEESFTYRWRHSDREVLDASIEIINEILGDEHEFLFLMENQWWPGFKFTDPHDTAYLLERVNYEKRGIMLDTGHLMSCNTALQTQSEGAEYIHRMLDRHGELTKAICGLHLHYSLSGSYVRAHTGYLPAGYPQNDPWGQSELSFRQVQMIDAHTPWTDPAVAEVVERIAPQFVTHELKSYMPAQKLAEVRLQQLAMMGRR